jgi:hypothetical protein
VLKRLGFWLGLPLILLAASLAVARTPLLLSIPTVLGVAIETSSAPDNFGTWTVVTQNLDQDNATTIQASSSLCFTAAQDASYMVQASLLYSGDGALGGGAGFDFALTGPTNTFGHFRSFTETLAGSGATTARAENIWLWAAAPVQALTFGALTRPYVQIIHYGTVRAPRAPDSGGQVCLTFAAHAAGTTRLWSGSTLAWRVL